MRTFGSLFFSKYCCSGALFGPHPKLHTSKSDSTYSRARGIYMSQNDQTARWDPTGMLVYKHMN